MEQKTKEITQILDLDKPLQKKVIYKPKKNNLKKIKYNWQKLGISKTFKYIFELRLLKLADKIPNLNIHFKYIIRGVLGSINLLTIIAIILGIPFFLFITLWNFNKVIASILVVILIIYIIGGSFSPNKKLINRKEVNKNGRK